MSDVWTAVPAPKQATEDALEETTNGFKSPYGLRVCLAGLVSQGKSSVFNALVGARVAQTGLPDARRTTREPQMASGVPLDGLSFQASLCDLPGIAAAPETESARETEAAYTAMTWKVAEGSGLVLWCSSSQTAFSTQYERESFQQLVAHLLDHELETGRSHAVAVLLTKCDFSAEPAAPPPAASAEPAPAVPREIPLADEFDYAKVVAHVRQLLSEPPFSIIGARLMLFNAHGRVMHGCDRTKPARYVASPTLQAWVANTYTVSSAAPSAAPSSAPNAAPSAAPSSAPTPHNTSLDLSWWYDGQHARHQRMQLRVVLNQLRVVVENPVPAPSPKLLLTSKCPAGNTHKAGFGKSNCLGSRGGSCYEQTYRGARDARHCDHGQYLSQDWIPVGSGRWHGVYQVCRHGCRRHFVDYEVLPCPWGVEHLAGYGFFEHVASDKTTRCYDAEYYVGLPGAACLHGAVPISACTSGCVLTSSKPLLDAYLAAHHPSEVIQRYRTTVDMVRLRRIQRLISSFWPPESALFADALVVNDFSDLAREYNVKFETPLPNEVANWIALNVNFRGVFRSTEPSAKHAAFLDKLFSNQAAIDEVFRAMQTRMPKSRESASIYYWYLAAADNFDSPAFGVRLVSETSWHSADKQRLEGGDFHSMRRGTDERWMPNSCAQEGSFIRDRGLGAGREFLDAIVDIRMRMYGADDVSTFDVRGAMANYYDSSGSSECGKIRSLFIQRPCNFPLWRGFEDS